MPQELMKEFIGKVCTIILFNESFDVTLVLFNVILSPQLSQKRLPSSIFLPHFEQYIFPPQSSYFYCRFLLFVTYVYFKNKSYLLYYIRAKH